MRLFITDRDEPWQASKQAPGLVTVVWNMTAADPPPIVQKGSATGRWRDMPADRDGLLALLLDELGRTTWSRVTIDGELCYLVEVTNGYD